MCDKVKDAIKTIIEYIDEDNTDSINNTPARFLKMLDEFFDGYKQNPAEILAKTHECKPYNGNMIIVKNVEFHSMCEHHLMPFSGKASIAYIANDNVVGLSKLARIVQVFAHRLQLQERMTAQIAESIQENLNPKGVAVYISAEHYCMKLRGTEVNDCCVTDTMIFRGKFENDQSLKMQFLTLINKN